jgi:L-fuculose-phosphate aldolase
MHTSVYRATDAGAVVHSHPLYCTALSVTMDEVPPVHYMITLLGGPVRVAPYARFGSPELAQGSVAAMVDRTGVLLRNHGATSTATPWPRPTPAPSTWSGYASLPPSQADR